MDNDELKRNYEDEIEACMLQIVLSTNELKDQYNSRVVASAFMTIGYGMMQQENENSYVEMVKKNDRSSSRT